jgi:hypothetical protein
MSADLEYRPGYSALRLGTIRSLPHDEKTKLLESVANDMTAALIQIGRESEAGSLSAANTVAVNKLIETVQSPEVKKRERLEAGARKYHRKLRETRRLRNELRVMIDRAERQATFAVGQWKTRLQDSNHRLAVVQRRAHFLQSKFDRLSLSPPAAGTTQVGKASGGDVVDVTDADVENQRPCQREEDGGSDADANCEMDEDHIIAVPPSDETTVVA